MVSHYNPINSSFFCLCTKLNPIQCCFSLFKMLGKSSIIFFRPDFTPHRSSKFNNFVFKKSFYQIFPKILIFIVFKSRNTKWKKDFGGIFLPDLKLSLLDYSFSLDLLSKFQHLIPIFSFSLKTKKALYRILQGALSK